MWEQVGEEEHSSPGGSLYEEGVQSRRKAHTSGRDVLSLEVGA